MSYIVTFEMKKSLCPVGRIPVNCTVQAHGTSKKDAKNLRLFSTLSLPFYHREQTTHVPDNRLH